MTGTAHSLGGDQSLRQPLRETIEWHAGVQHRQARELNDGEMLRHSESRGDS